MRRRRFAGEVEVRSGASAGWPRPVPRLARGGDLPDGKNVYVASSSSDAVAIFKRSSKDGTLSQPSGAGGCISQGGAGGCETAAGLDGPNSVAVSPDGQNVYATSVDSDSIAIFRRNPSNGALSQAPGDAGCISEGGAGGCRSGRALDGADVVVTSADGANVYVGAFFGSAIAAFDRDEATGALVQPPGPTGCVTNIPDPGCVNGRAMGAIEGLAISEDGTSVYAAAAASNALAILDRDPATGALSQASDGTGCITQSETTGCTTGTQLSGANAVAVSPDDETVYVTSLFSNSVTTFARTPATGDAAQLEGTAGCLVYLVAIGCSPRPGARRSRGTRALARRQEPLRDRFHLERRRHLQPQHRVTGEIAQKALKAGCTAIRQQRNCTFGRGLVGSSSAAVSPDGKFVYLTAFGSDAVAVFQRLTKNKRP